jgi:hypothetical protein
MKTHFKKLKNPNFVGSWDLADSDGNFIEKDVTISGVEKDTVHDGKGGSEQLPILKFKEVKPMVMNATNLKKVAKITGSPYIEDWIGVRIRLFVQKVKAFGEYHDALRIKESAPVKKPPLSEERFRKALESVKVGNYDIEKLKSDFALTKTQLDELSKL